MTEEVLMKGEVIAEPQVDSSSTDEAEHINPQAEKPVNQEAVNKRINDITAQKYAEKQRADAAERRLAEIEAERSKVIAPAGQEYAQPQALKPPSVDLYYENEAEFNRQTEVYQEQLTRKILDDQQRSARDAEMRRAEQERINRQNAESQRAIIESATAHNIDIDELDRSAGVLQSRGVNPLLGEMLFGHEKSAPLMDYLAKNPAEFEQINQLGSSIAILRRLDQVAPKALQRNISNTPDPVTGLSGLPAREGDEFDRKCQGAVFK